MGSDQDSPVVGLVLDFHGAERTAFCAHALLKAGVFAMLVIDNSEDDGQNAAKLRELLVESPQVVIEGSGRNLGFAAGVNHGLSRCRELWPGSNILLINNDAVLAPYALTLLVRVIKGPYGALLAAPQIRRDGVIEDPLYYHRATGLMFRRAGRGRFRILSGCCVLMSAQFCSEVPLYDEDFFMYGEDVELSWRLTQSRFATAYVSEAMVDHEGSASAGNTSFFYETNTVVGHVLLASKLANSWMQAIVFNTLRIVVLSLRSIIRTLRQGQITPIIGLFYGYWIAIGKMRKRRMNLRVF